MAASSSHNHRPSSGMDIFSPQPPQRLLSMESPSTTMTAAAANCQNPSPTDSTLESSPQDLLLSNSTHLTRQEVLSRRARNLRRLSKCYRDHYWALMEDLRDKYRDYVWKFGLSPFKEDEDERETAKDGENGAIEGSGDSNANGNGNNNLLCAFYGCKLKAMALTAFCHLHILSDSKQKLYKPCDYVIKSAQAGPITCGKPILRSTVPSLCNVHWQKAQKHVTRALKKAGLNNISSSSKVAPKFHLVVAEYVREIQTKRRAALRTSKYQAMINKHEHGS